tara:strand:+ start:92 stop:589 length:498 start_codon:yes stop_codon:yes gene_type:complete
MKVEKYIKAKTEIDYFFVKGNLNIDAEHYIKKIEEASSFDHKSNIVGLMTDWKYFLNDKNFFKEIIIPVLDLLEEENFNRKYLLCDAWGFRHNFSEYTKQHDHFPSFLSGAVMLNEHPQSLIFPKLNEQLDSKPGNFCIFSSFIKHQSKRNYIDKPRYGLSFNLE